MITVFIVDDVLLVRTAIKKLLETAPALKVLGEAGTGEEALHTLRQIKPDVVLLDIDLPDISGLEVAQRLLRRGTQSKIVVLTGSQDDIFSTRFLNMGVAGYLIKDSDPEQLTAAIFQADKKKPYISPATATRMAFKIIDNTPSPFSALSDRELEFLLLTLRGDTTKKIADKLHLSTRTIRDYRPRIFKKLKIRKDTDLVNLALRYKLIPDERLVFLKS